MTTATSTTVTTAVLAAEAREFARQQGVEVGTRGRLSSEHFTNYFASQPKRAREVARSLGIDVGARGRMSRQNIEVVSLAVR